MKFQNGAQIQDERPNVNLIHLLQKKLIRLELLNSKVKYVLSFFHLNSN
jgi:hypothetical protein